MRFKLILERIRGREIPINYQYELSSVIYHILANSNREYSEWLHDNGFQDGKKPFKLFSFSRLSTPFQINRESYRLVLRSNRVEWMVTFLTSQSTKNFIEGVFKDQVFDIADSEGGATFRVKEIQMMPTLENVENLDDIVYQTLSPICISQRNDRGYPDYLSPEHPCYSQAILSGLLARYRAVCQTDFVGETYCHFKLMSTPRSSLITIKSGTKFQTKVRGYSFDFKLELPFELLQIAYESGVGEKGSMGFGMIQAKGLI